MIRRVFGPAAVLAATVLLGSVSGALAQQAAEHRGGTLRLVARAAAGTIDPQVNYTLQFWQVLGVAYDGLLSYKKVGDGGGVTIVADLAESLPEPQDGGLTYTFKIRPGIKFSDGSDLSAADVVATFQRIFKVSSPTAGSFFAGIVGSEKCLAEPKSCTLEGGISADEAAGTVTFHLKQPDPEFFSKLTVQHSFIVPSEAPASDVGVTAVPGTGPYRIEAYDPNRQLKLVRNEHFKAWNPEAQPEGYPDEIVYDFGLTEEAQVTAIQNGQADWMFEQPPTDRLAEIGSRYADQVHLSPLTAIYPLSMNTRIPPFDNIKARQAVNYAVDRAAVVKLFGGPNLATPHCQILPPGVPGYEPYCPYTLNPGAAWSAPDLEKAKALVQESGTAGQEVALIVEDTGTGRAIGTYMQDVLTSIGYKATSKPISTNIHFTYIQNSNNRVQISLSYWLQDYPAPSDFLNVLFSCASFHEGSDSSINMSAFCDAETEGMMQAAMTQSISDAGKANALWAAVDRKVTDMSPDAVLFVPKHVDFVSKRLGNFTFNPQHFFVLSQAWVQ